MKPLRVAQATAPLADCAGDVKNEPLILTMPGTTVAALIPLDNAVVETVILSWSFLLRATFGRAWRIGKTTSEWVLAGGPALKGASYARCRWFPREDGRDYSLNQYGR
jgi:hypothetical protein